MKAMIDALNVVNDEKEKRSFVKLNLVSLLFTLIAILSLMIALAAVVIAPIIVFCHRSFVCLRPCHRRSAMALVVGRGGSASPRSIAWAKPTEARWQWLPVREAWRAGAIAWLYQTLEKYSSAGSIADFGADRVNATESLGAGRLHDDADVHPRAIVTLAGGELNAQNQASNARHFDGWL